MSSVAPLLGVCLTLVVYWPGYMSADSIVQLGQARMLEFSDWHPPLMSLLWAGLDELLPGPGLMLVFQALLFWGGLWLLLLMLTGPLFAALLTLVIGLSPGIFSIVGTIWKDVHMVGALLGACGLMMLAARSQRRAFLLASSMLLMSYAVAVRHNAAAAVVPLAFVWLGSAVPRLARASFLTRGAAAFAVAVVLFAGTGLLAKRLTGGKSDHIEQLVLWHDLAAVSLATGTNLFPFAQQPGDDAAQLALMREHYRPITVNSLFWGPVQVAPLLSDEVKLRKVRAAWLAAITRHPLAYLKHRLEGFRHLMAFRTRWAGYAFHEGIDSNDLGVVFEPRPVNTRVTELFRSLHHGRFFFRGWIYMAITLVGLALVLIRREHHPLVPAMLISAQLYTAPYLLIGLGPDFRYLWWPVVVALLFLATTAWRVLPARYRR